jgi:NADPH-ferrihemoprotein reductase
MFDSDSIISLIIVSIGLAIAYVFYWRNQKQVQVKSLTISKSSSTTSTSTSTPSTNTFRSTRNNAISANTSSTTTATTSTQKSASSATATAPTTVAKNHLSLFFGSQTGTAEDFARQIAKQAKAGGFDAKVRDLEEFDAASMLQHLRLAVFFVATYGEGEPTDNAKEFYDWLCAASRDDVDLSHLQFAVFGLGNKTYEHYNSVGITVDRRLAELGGTRVVALGLGDDDSSLEDDFAAWRANLLPPFAALAGIDSEAAAAEQSTHASFTLRSYAPTSSEAKRAIANAATDTGGVGTSSTSVSKFDVKTPLAAYIAVNRELHGEHSDRSCRHIEIETGGRLHYEVGDHVGVFAENELADVERLAARLGAALDSVVSLVEPDSNRVMLGPCTVRNALLRYVEINGAIRQSSLSLLLPHVTDDAERQRLRDWTAAGSESYARDVRDASRTLLEILADMPSLKPPLGVVLELLPRLAPRYYSISSAPAAHGTRIHVTAVVVRNTTSTGRIFTGLCTGFFARTAATPHQPVACFVRRSTFKLPRSLAAPLIMFGPGTGIAPFRGFIHDLRSRSAAATAPVASTDRVLYFGCRQRTIDGLYMDELDGARTDGTLSQVHVAESRRAENAARKYVQHILLEPDNAAAAADILLRDPQSHLFVCGDARAMAKDVHEALLHALSKRLDDSKEKAEAILTRMTQESRYLKDVWY